MRSEPISHVGIRSDAGQNSWESEPISPVGMHGDAGKNSWESAPFLSVGALRKELAHFGEQSLRQNILAELRMQLRQDLQEVFSNVLDSTSGATGGAAGRRTQSASNSVYRSSLRIRAGSLPDMVGENTVSFGASDGVQAPEGPAPSLKQCWRSTAHLTVPFDAENPPDRQSSSSETSAFYQSQEIECLRPHNHFFAAPPLAAGSMRISKQARKSEARVSRMTLTSPKERAQRKSALHTVARTFNSSSNLPDPCLSHGQTVRLSRELKCTTEASALKRIVYRSALFLENTVSLFIILNAIFMGVQTDYQARNVTEAVPRIFSGMEMFFCAIFTSELLLKLIAYRQRLFFMKDWSWNLFDSLLVAIQLIEVIGMLSAYHDTDEESRSTSPVGNLSFLRLLRALRLLRVLRLIRLLHFIGELAEIINNIYNCLRPFLWTVLLLLIIIYMLAIVFTQIVFAQRFEMRDSPSADWTVDDDLELEHWWGSVARSVFSLYKSILGGIDWDNVVQPLQDHIHPVVPGIIFSVYIAFTLLCMMNIITGTFVNSAMKSAENQKEREFVEFTRGMFKRIDEADVAVVTLSQFHELLEDVQFQYQLGLIGISDADARLLFTLLDKNASGEVEFDKLLANMLRLHQESKFMDIMKLMYVVEGQQQMFEGVNRQESPGRRETSRDSVSVMGSTASQSPRDKAKLSTTDTIPLIGHIQEVEVNDIVRPSLT